MNATTYAGITPVTDPNTPYLGGNIKEGDPYTFCPRVWTYVIERFCIRSVLDLGSGIGNAADWFFKKGLRTVAVDGLQSNIAESDKERRFYEGRSSPLSGSCRTHRGALHQPSARKFGVRPCGTDNPRLARTGWPSSCQLESRRLLDRPYGWARLQFHDRR